VLTTSPRRPSEKPELPAPEIDQFEITTRVSEILNRHPAVGLAVGVVHGGSLEFFNGRGVADIASNTPITKDTVFRIGSITKTFTAIAVMQLWEQGLVDLDAPANDYLRAYKLVPANAGFRPATVRHLLTHTAGIPEVLHIADLLHPDWGPFDSRPAAHSVKLGDRVPSLAKAYRGGLRQVAEPGMTFAYTNHGFATLGQIVEDVSGMPLEPYFREHARRVPGHRSGRARSSNATMDARAGTVSPRSPRRQSRAASEGSCRHLLAHRPAADHRETATWRVAGAARARR
jgi:CubicO group peptidase (beta-lactamase class C family)